LSAELTKNALLQTVFSLFCPLGRTLKRRCLDVVTTLKQRCSSDLYRLG